MSIDTMWMLLCAFLVIVMQAGFTCLESGLVRAKNNINVAIKNLIDFCISVLLFALFGFGLMFGTSANGLIGIDEFLIGPDFTPERVAFFFFQAAFCGTAVTIVSGAVAERMKFLGYACTAAILSALIYPVTGHWTWARDANGDAAGWLAQLGFHDFAGSTVVHSVGGWVALAAIFVLGPRLGRYGPKARSLDGHNLALATLGVFLLWFGWFGFNGGSTLALTDKVPMIVTNTLLAGAVGGLVAMAATLWMDGRSNVPEIMNGVLAGLVAITACCDLVTPLASLAIGGIAACVSLAGSKLLARWRIDDAIGAVPVHLFGGAWGTIAVALFAPDGSWASGNTRIEQFGVQLLGIVVVGAYCFGASYAALKLLGRWMPLRVTRREEHIGLNIAEHGATTSLLDLISQMDVQANSGDFSRPVRVEDATEAGDIAAFYNAVLEKFNLETDRRKMAMQRLSQLANLDALTGLANRRLFFEGVRRALAHAHPQRRGYVMYLDLDGFKRINDHLGHEAGDKLLREIGYRLAASVRQNDIVGRLGGDEFAILAEDVALPEAHAAEVATALLQRIAHPIDIDGTIVHVGSSIGIETFGFDPTLTVKSVVRHADHAMYVAKLAGKGVYRFYNDDSDEFAPQVG